MRSWAYGAFSVFESWELTIAAHGTMLLTFGSESDAGRLVAVGNLQVL